MTNEKLVSISVDISLKAYVEPDSEAAGSIHSHPRSNWLPAAVHTHKIRRYQRRYEIFLNLLASRHPISAGTSQPFHTLRPIQPLFL